MAALTASTQLTYLNVAGHEGVGRAFVLAHQYNDMFPEGREMPHLQGLRATMGLLDNDSPYLVTKCCPRLQVRWC